MEPQLLSFDVPDFGQPESTHRIVCWQWGNADAPRTLICLHGLTRNGRDFDALAQALANDYRVLCPDMAGRGKSAWLKNPAGYSYPAYVGDMMFLLRSIIPPPVGGRLGGGHSLAPKPIMPPPQPSPYGGGSIDWIGTSMGGIVGMMLANAWPGLIRKLVLNDIGALVSAAGLRRIMSYAGAKASYANRAEAEAALRERCATFGIQTEAQWRQFFAHSFMDNSDGTVSVACDPMIAANLPKLEEVKDVDLWKLWGAVKKIPTLLIRGAESDILTHETALQMKKNHPDMTLQEIPNTGHAPALMDASQVALIRSWLARPYEKRTTSFLRSLYMRFFKK